MKTADINEGLVGKKVKGIFTAKKVTGVIVKVIEGSYTKGVKICMDEPVRWGDDYYETYESTARKSDDWGNLQHTEIID